MTRKQSMQFHVKDEPVGRSSTPTLNHSQIRNGVKRRIYLDHLKILRVPTKSLMRAQLFRIPMLNKTRVGPACGPDENLSILRRDRSHLWFLQLIVILSENEEFRKVGSSNYFRSEEHTSELQSRRDLVCRL